MKLKTHNANGFTLMKNARVSIITFNVIDLYHEVYNHKTDIYNVLNHVW